MWFYDTLSQKEKKIIKKEKIKKVMSFVGFLGGECVASRCMANMDVE